jgi:hypothetical protein
MRVDRRNHTRFGLNLYGAFGVKAFWRHRRQSGMFKFLCLVGEPFLRLGLHFLSEPRGTAVNIDTVANSGAAWAQH